MPASQFANTRRTMIAFPLRIAVVAHLLASGGAAMLRAGASKSARNTLREAAGLYSYDYSTHGQNWMQGQCASRQRQSPIDIPIHSSSIPTHPVGVLAYDYQEITSAFTLMNNGHLFSADLASGGYGGITYNNGFWNLMSVSVHAYSEHTFHTRHHPLELQMVHKSADSDALLIVAVPITCASIPPMLLQLGHEKEHAEAGAAGTKAWAEEQLEKFRKHLAVDEYLAKEDSKRGAGCMEANATATAGQTFTTAPPCAPRVTQPGYGGYSAPPFWQWNFNGELQKFLSAKPPPPNMKVQVPIVPSDPLDLNKFLEGANYYTYSGSLTAPPCAEIVTWMVRDTPVMAADLQVAFFVDGLFRMNNFYGNYRDVMPLMGRQIGLRRGQRGTIPLVATDPVLPLGDTVDTLREAQTRAWANEAVGLASQTADYVKKLGTRVKTAMDANVDFNNLSGYPDVIAPPPATTAAPTDLEAVARAMKQMIAEAAHDAVAEATPQIKKIAEISAQGAAYKAAATVSAGYLVRTTPMPVGDGTQVETENEREAGSERR